MDEQRLVRTAIQQVHEGQGRALVFEGPMGVGRTVLLGLVRKEAADAGMRVLDARGTAMESDFCFGVVRQLFEPWYASVSGAERARALAGPARCASSLFDFAGTRTAEPGTGPDAQPRTVHALHWLSVQLAADRPLVLLVDDLHWSDEQSLRFFSYLTNRMDQHRILLVASARAGHGPHAPAVLPTLSASPLTTTVVLNPLGADEVRTMATNAVEEAPDDDFVAACLHLTGGLPLLLRELLTEAEAQGIRPCAADVPALRALEPPGVSRLVGAELATLPHPAVRLAHAMSVLNEAVRADAGAVCGLDTAGTDAAVEALEAAGILVSRTSLAFTAPLIRAAVYRHMPDSDRRRAHGSAARILAERTGDLGTVVEHLLHTRPAADPWVATALWGAGRDAFRAGDVYGAVPLLRRALAEPVPQESRGLLLAELGAAELRARETPAPATLARALAVAPPEHRFRVGLDAAQALALSGRHTHALSVLDALRKDGRAAGTSRARDALGTAVNAEDARAVVDAALVTVTGAVSWTRPLSQVYAAEFSRAASDSRPGASRQILRVQLALDELAQGVPANRVAERILRDTDPLALVGDHDSEAQPGTLAAWALALCDRLVEADDLLVDTARQARGNTLILAGHATTALRSLVLYGRGELEQAERSAQAALEATGPGLLGGATRPLALATLLHCLLDRGDADTAEDALSTFGYASSVQDTPVFDALLDARGRLHLARGRSWEGLYDLLDGRRGTRENSRLGRAALPCWPLGALELARLGRSETARNLAEREVERAQTFGADRPTAVALRTLGLLEEGDTGLAHLLRAAELLEDSPARLERAITHVELGAALCRSGQRAAARRHLSLGRELAEECGASRLSRRAEAESRAAGLQARTTRRSKGDLTPSEIRVARMAADGMRNQEIAQHFFITVKTVEWHLTQVYRKLGITSRAGLSAALPPTGT
ncbi:AAA family ATPase [Streptomyces sp. AS02]|uniref:helix-turn-helix transcriptional regulator n=1 Tax=Streptomyces sp. AS02 TaxID=2938946 RepID=UPI0020228E69|nr:AAA family ATPase [Streptomyces sp. AS02]MCL8015959.1 AAA family ATPase [Streptomyces sp. AS02]